MTIKRRILIAIIFCLLIPEYLTPFRFAFYNPAKAGLAAQNWNFVKPLSF